MWTCGLCGQTHSEAPLCYGADAPWRELVSEEEFAQRVELSGDQCVVDEKVFFVRGHIEIPVHGLDQTLAWSVWCSLSEESFRDMTERWEDPERPGICYFGWLCTEIPVYPSTIHLKTSVRSREVGTVPLVEVQQSDHPLYEDQVRGIGTERLEKIAHEILHEAAR